VRGRKWWLRILGVGVTIAWLPAGASTQQIQLQVKEQVSLTPVAGALVRLLGERGVIMQTLTNEAGRATLRTATAGSYRIRIDRIGSAGVVTAPFLLGLNETRETALVIQSDRLTLPPLEVRGNNRCGRRTDEGTTAAVIWAEIAKALYASVIAEESHALPLLARGFRRELRRDRTPVREWIESASFHRGRFYAAPEPGVLIKDGFVVADEHDSVTYAAPDAHLLLSDDFVDTHCFIAIPGQDGLIGLAFTPMPGRKVVDVQGTLWVNRASSELKFLEFAYTGLPRDLQRLALGGRVDYLRLSTGAWIVSSWYVRTPRLESFPARSESRVPLKVVGRGSSTPTDTPTHITGFLEVGGRISLHTGNASPIDRAFIVGRVVDSTTDTGLAGVVLRLKGAVDSVLSDSDGVFMLALSAHGDHALLATHSKLTLPGSHNSQAIMLSLGDTSHVAFSSPSARTLARPFCGRRNDQANIVGRVVEPDGAPIPRQEVRAQWQTPAGATKQIRVWSEATGLFAFCNLPPDEVISVVLFDQKQPLVKQTVDLEWGSVHWLDLRRPGVR